MDENDVPVGIAVGTSEAMIACAIMSSAAASAIFLPRCLHLIDEGVQLPLKLRY